MKIVYLAAGAAGMYCGSCLHDNTLAAALIAAGEDILLVPTYTPLRTDDQDVSLRRVFYGGINVYLQQKSALFRHTPWFVDALLNSPSLIERATRRGASVDPASLGELTVSMLEGEHGRQSKELAKLIRWLQREARPDVVQLSNALLLGMAREIRALGAPVICGLSGEDLFLEQLPAPYYERARTLLRERAAEVDGFLAMNDYYANYMANYLDVPRERIDVIRPGINLAGHDPSPARHGGAPFTIGYLARICPEKGLHNLVAAAEVLAANPHAPPFRVRVAGYLGERDRPYLATIEERMKDWISAGRFEYVGEVTRAEKLAFLSTLDVMCVPTVYHESKGLSLIEALASGVPIVEPAHGVFPELIADTRGGLLADSDSPAELAAVLRRLMVEPGLAEELGRQGRAAVHERYSAQAMAEETAALYRETIARAQTAGRPAPPATGG